MAFYISHRAQKQTISLIVVYFPIVMTGVGCINFNVYIWSKYYCLDRLLILAALPHYVNSGNIFFLSLKFCILMFGVQMFNRRHHTDYKNDQLPMIYQGPLISLELTKSIKLSISIHLHHMICDLSKHYDVCRKVPSSHCFSWVGYIMNKLSDSITD